MDDLRRSPGGGGPPPPYHAGAVHFDGATSLSNASLVSTDNTFLSVAGWAKVSQASFVTNNNDLFVADPTGNYSPNFQFVKNLSPGGVSAEFDVYNGTSESAGVANHASFNFDTWGFVIYCIDTSAPDTFVMYFGDTNVALIATVSTPPFPFNCLTNGRAFYFGDDSFGDFIIGDYADWRIMPGTNLIVGGDIPLATRRLFIDASGKPVDPATATATLGAPCILFSGDATSFGTNQGTGGAFTTNGTLTNATTSPSD